MTIYEFNFNIIDIIFDWQTPWHVTRLTLDLQRSLTCAAAPVPVSVLSLSIARSRGEVVGESAVGVRVRCERGGHVGGEVGSSMRGGRTFPTTVSRSRWRPFDDLPSPRLPPSPSCPLGCTIRRNWCGGRRCPGWRGARSWPWQIRTVVIDVVLPYYREVGPMNETQVL